MINFPIFNRLNITGYGLFPGTNENEQGIQIEFRPGFTLILGANGLGKTTLITIIYRLLTGPYDIPGISSGTALGNINLNVKPLSQPNRKIFAQRVADGARNSIARLEFQLGNHEVVLVRRLRDLRLEFFSVDGKTLTTDESETYQTAIIELAGLWSFGDWILLLRHLVFYFEDRRALVWDTSAQRQVLRFLFLPIEIARKWAEDERAILELDSRMRNLNAAVTKEERALARNEVKVEKGIDILESLQLHEKLQKIDEEQLERLEGEVVEIDVRRKHARLQLLKAEQQHEHHFRELAACRTWALQLSL